MAMETPNIEANVLLVMNYTNTPITLHERAFDSPRRLVPANQRNTNPPRSVDLRWTRLAISLARFPVYDLQPQILKLTLLPAAGEPPSSRLVLPNVPHASVLITPQIPGRAEEWGLGVEAPWE